MIMVITEEVRKVLKKSPKADVYSIWTAICKKVEPKFTELTVKDVLAKIKAKKLPSTLSVYKAIYNAKKN